MSERQDLETFRRRLAPDIRHLLALAIEEYCSKAHSERLEYTVLAALRCTPDGLVADGKLRLEVDLTKRRNPSEKSLTTRP